MEEKEKQLNENEIKQDNLNTQNEFEDNKEEFFENEGEGFNFNELENEVEAIDSKVVEDNKIEELKDKFRTAFKKERSFETIKIDDEYIKSQPKDIQEILKPIKGDILTERALKNYINAQLYIKRHKHSPKEEFKPEKTQKQPTEQEFFVEQKESIPQVQYKKEYFDNIEKAVAEALSAKYKDMQVDYDNPDESIREYASDLQISDPIKYYQFLKDYELAKNRISEEINKYKYVVDNWQQISVENIKKDVEKFKQDLEEVGLTLEDLNLNLELDDKLYNKYLYENIFAPNGKVNTEVVVPLTDDAILIPEGAVYKKLVELNYKNILKLKKSNLPIGKNEKAKLPPSMSTYQSQGAKNFRTSVDIEDILEDTSKDIDDEVLEKYKEQIRSSIIGMR